MKPNELLMASSMFGFDPFAEPETTDKAIAWYKTLDLNQKINIKGCFDLLCGMGWQEIAFIIPLGERIKLAYDKLKLEGFDVD